MKKFQREKRETIKYLVRKRILSFIMTWHTREVRFRGKEMPIKLWFGKVIKLSAKELEKFSFWFRKIVNPWRKVIKLNKVILYWRVFFCIILALGKLRFSLIVSIKVKSWLCKKQVASLTKGFVEHRLCHCHH